MLAKSRVNLIIRNAVKEHVSIGSLSYVFEIFVVSVERPLVSLVLSYQIPY